MFGIVFGILLNKGRVTDYNVIVNFFRLKDLTVLKIMLTAIIVGGLGVFAMNGFGWIEGYHIKDANLAGMALGSAIFGVGMAVYGFCPGTAVAAIATGRLHALVGFFGMLTGGMIYAFSYPWLKTNVISIGQMGKVQLNDVTGLPMIGWWVILTAAAAFTFWMIERKRTANA
ncbi:MAG: YeeE/YedE family protein [Verrucomicrobiales bacterium]|nr:YeeE/YedE family protein [Verrucomicrobiales bacterium]